MLDEFLFGRRIKPGQEVIISGGYEFKSAWGEEEKRATVIKFFPGQGKTQALLVEFKHPSPFVGFVAQYAVLELSYEDREWRDGATCRVEACELIPEDKEWKDRVHGTAVESHAIIRIAKK